MLSLSNTADAAFYLKDAFSAQGTTGNLTVEICSNSLPPAANDDSSKFQFWVNDNLVSITSANYSQCASGIFGNNGTDFLRGNLTQAECPLSPPTLPVPPPWDQCAKFALNVSWSDSQTILNVSANLTPGDVQGLSQRWTLNYINIRSNVINTLIMAQDQATKMFGNEGPAMTDAFGYYLEHCRGSLTGTECLPVAAPAGCAIHGIPFPNVGTSCSNGTYNLIFFDFISSNSSSRIINFSNTSSLLINLTDPTTLAMIEAFPFFGEPGENPEQPFINFSSIYNYSSGEMLFNLSAPGGQGGGPPGFIIPNEQYIVRVNGVLGASAFDWNFSFIPMGKGMSGAIISIKEATDFTTFIGKVINKTDAVVPNAAVYAQPFFGFTPPMGVNIVNSSFTDENGIFRIRVPKNIPYKFLIVSGSTNNATGSLVYNPTKDTNNGRGFMAIQDTVILPTSTIQSGGTINLNVILNNATGVHSEIARVLDLPGGVTQDAFSAKITPLKLFQTVTLPANLYVPLVAPINSVLLNIYGINISEGGGGGPPSTTHICFNTTTVTQGQITDVSCTLNNTPGTMNLIVTDCQDSLWTCLNNQTAWGIWFDSRIVIYGSSGIVAEIEEGSMAQESSFNNPGKVEMKLPVGAYNISIIPKHPWGAPTGVFYTNSFVITAGNTTNVRVKRQAPGWMMEPFMPFQIRSSQNNPIALAVYDFGANPPAILNDTRISVELQALQMNGSYAGNMSAGLQMSFQSDLRIPGPISDPGAFNVSFRPSDYSIPAGKYMMLFNATTTSGAADQAHFNTLTFPFTVSDYDIGVDLAKFSWARTETIQGKIFAYLNNGTGLSGNATITFYDFTGVQVGSSTAVIVTNGEGTLSIPVSSFTSLTGFFEMVTVLNASGSFGFSNNFIEVTDLIVQTDFDRQSYKPTDDVVLKVTVLNASGSEIQGASIEGFVDAYQNSTFGNTDAAGEAALTFSPATFTGGNWTFGFHSIKLKIAYSTATQLVQQEVYTGFEVRGFDVQIFTDKPTYQPTDNVTLNIIIRGAPGNPELLVDGVQYEPGQDDITQTPFGFKVIIVPIGGSWVAGHHEIKFSFSQGTSTQSTYTGFDVNVYSIIAQPDKWSYQLGDTATISVKVINGTNSTPISGVTVNGTLFKFQQSGDLQVNTSNNVTDSSGVGVLEFNLTKTGFHYVKITVGGNQVTYTGFLVSGMSVSLTTNQDSYSPGDTLIATINVTGANASNASLSAKLFAFGSFRDLSTTGVYFIGSGATGPYYANLTYTIPSNAPAITYFLDVKATTVNGEIGFGSIPVRVTGGQKLSVVADQSFTQPYMIGETGVFTATLVNANNNTAINGTNVTFEIGSSTGTPAIVGSALTDTAGKAVMSVPASSMPSSDGFYFMHAYVTNNPTVQAYTGFTVSSLLVDLGVGSTNEYTLGQNITFSVNVTNATTGAAVTPTSGSIVIWDKNRGEITFPLTISGSQPYTTTQTIPNDPSAIGTYTVIALMSLNASMGSDSLLLKVTNSSTPINITLPSNMTAENAFDVNISILNVPTATGSLRVFSPSASNLTYINNSINISGGSVNVSVNITTPGKYVFIAEIEGYGSASSVGVVTAAANAFVYRTWTTSDTAGTNSTSFSAGATAYIWSNTQNTTAVVMTQNTTTNATSSSSLPVIIASGNNYFTTFSNTISGQTYFVRLDTSTTAGVATTMFRVT